MSYEAAIGDDQLGFSFKPGRKAKKFFRKIRKPLLIGAGLTAAMFIPGVAAGALKAGRAAARGTGLLISRLHPKFTVPIRGPSTAPIQTAPSPVMETGPVPSYEGPVASGGGGGGGGFATDMETGEPVQSAGASDVAIRTAGQAVGPAALLVLGLVIAGLAASRRR